MMCVINDSVTVCLYFCDLTISVIVKLSRYDGDE